MCTPRPTHTLYGNYDLTTTLSIPTRLTSIYETEVRLFGFTQTHTLTETGPLTWYTTQSVLPASSPIGTFYALCTLER